MKKTVMTSVLRGFLRLVRIIGYFLVFCMLLLLVLAIAANFYFNSEKLRQLAIQNVHSSLDRKLAIGSFSFNVFSGFEMRDVSLLPKNDSLDLFPLHRLTVKKIGLHYSLADILNRKIVIREIQLEQPEIELFVDMVDTTTVDLAALLATDLPISFDVKTVRCANARFQVVLADSQYCQTVCLGRADLHIDELYLPAKGWSANDSSLHGKFRLSCENTFIKMDYLDKPTRQRTLFSSDFNLTSDILVNTFHQIQTQTNLRLARLQLEYAGRSYSIPSAFDLGLRAEIDGKSGNGHLQCVFDVDQNRWLAAELQARDFSQQPYLRLEITHGEIPLQQALALAHLVAPDSLLTIALAPSSAPTFTFTGTIVEGRLATLQQPGNLTFQVNGRLSKAHLLDLHSHWLVRGAGLGIVAKGRSDGVSVQELSLSATAGMDSLNYCLNDSQAVYTGMGRMQIFAALNERLLPERTQLTLTINNCLGGQIDGDMNLQGAKSLEQLHGQGHLTLTNLPFSKVPNVPLEGRLTGECRFDVQGLRKIHAEFSAAAEAMRMPGDEEPIPLPAIRLAGRTLAATDTTFARITLDSITVQMNDVLRLQAAGVIGLSDQTVRIAPCQMIVDHGAALEMIPAVFREKIRDLQITGQTQLDLEAQIAMVEAGLNYRVHGTVQNRRTSVYDPERLLSLGGLHVNSEFNLDSATGVDAEVSLLLDSLATTGYGMPLCLHNQFHVKAGSKDLQKIVVKNGRLAMPDIRTVLDFDAMMNGDQATARVGFHQNIPDSFRVRDFMLKGRTDVELQITSDPDWVDLLADIRAEHWSIAVPGLLALSDLNAAVYTHQRYDVKAGAPLTSSEPKIATPTNAFIDYLLYSEYYRNRQPHLSRITIAKLDVMSYVLNDINLELLLDEGRLEIPSMSATLLGGNVGGRLTLDLAGGNLAAASYKMNAHFANINSYLLTRHMIIPKDDGVINGNLEFRGIGMDPEQQMILEGYFYITTIGPKAADNLLNYMDPENKDSGIRTSRMLIRNGFKPRLFTFDFRNLHIYPEINFIKPWYIPKGLESYTLNRIPLRYFLDRMKVRADWLSTAN
jgi:hypothetical protein